MIQRMTQNNKMQFVSLLLKTDKLTLDTVFLRYIYIYIYIYIHTYIHIYICFI